MLSKPHEIVVTPAETDVSIRIVGTAKVITVAAGDQVIVQQAWDTANLASQVAVQAAGTVASSVPTGTLDALFKSGWDFKNNGDGLMYDRAGVLISKPRSNEPLKTVYKDEQELLDDIEAKNYPNKVIVDGTLMPWSKYGLEPPAGFGSDAVTGELKALQVNPVSVATVVDVPAPTTSASSVGVIESPVNFQTKMYFEGDFKVTLPNLVAPVVPGHMAYVKVASITGSESPGGTLTVDAGGENKVSGWPGGTCWIAVGAAVEGATLTVPVGTTVVVTLAQCTSKPFIEYRSANYK